MHISLHICGDFALYMHIFHCEPVIALLFQSILLAKMHMRGKIAKNMQIPSGRYAYFRSFLRIYAQAAQNALTKRSYLLRST
ncbi:hypothetical protein D1155_13245 [Anaerotruncus sp. 80]|uniref:Uncharacterized protein n=1 Tax=Anaerotruncus colihominis TaxID=169435 RepID=A0A845QPH4_9FIRM|nr:hypothetical protein [Anaerotruncus colihominis]NCF00252.1 hypothetical protein [Emergencia sp. 1XD21-10]NCF03268.1 hypothetical protein [Anaerotruncus sp. 80]